jgi:hypothetical protein
VGIFWGSWTAAKPPASLILLERDDATYFVVCTSRGLFAHPGIPKYPHLGSTVFITNGNLFINETNT